MPSQINIFAFWYLPNLLNQANQQLLIVKNYIKKLLMLLGLIKQKGEVSILNFTLPTIDLDSFFADYNLQKHLGIQHQIFTSFETYQQYVKENEALFLSRYNFETALMKGKVSSFLVKGKSFLSKNSSNYRIAVLQGKEGPIYNLRETAICSKTNLNNRIRATLFAVTHSFSQQQLGSLSIYLTEAVTPLFHWFKALNSNTVGSEYLGNNIPSGTIVKGVMHQDITHLSLADNSFNVGVCLEVLEHVPNYTLAFSELARITKKGGSMFISVPFIEQNENTIIRASISTNGDIVHHLEPEYHGDPVNAEAGILCFQHFGWDITRDLKTAGFSEVKVHFIWSLEELIIGRHIIIFEAIK